MRLHGCGRAALGHSDAIQDAFDYRVGFDAVCLGLEAQYEAMAQDIGRDGLDVFGANEVAAGQPGVRARGAVKPMLARGLAPYRTCPRVRCLQHPAYASRTQR